MKLTSQSSGPCPLPEKEGWWIGFGYLDNAC